MAEPGPVSESESEDTDQAEPGRAPVEDQAAPGRAPVEDQEAPGRAQATDQITPHAEEQAAGHSRTKTGWGRGQTRSLDVDERLITALEAVSNRVVGQSRPPEDSDSLFFRSLKEDFKMLSHKTRQDLKFQMYRMVYEAKCREIDPWGLDLLNAIWFSGAATAAPNQRTEGVSENDDDKVVRQFELLL
ncbi:unnamed protein product [Boreogadus saida]